MNSEKIGFIEVIALISIVLTNKIILNTPKEIISNTGSSAWLNAIYISIIAVFLAWLIASLFKNFVGKDILDVSEFLGGNTLKIIMGILYIILLTLVPTIVIKNFSDLLKIVYFRNSPLIFILCFFLIASLIANKYSIKVISKANLIIIPVVLLSIIILLLSSIKDFVPQRLFPILGFGAKKTFFSGLTNLFSFSGLGYLLFIGPLLNKTKDFKKISVISISISGIYLFLSVLCILLSLTYTFRSGESFSLYLLSRNIEYGRFFQRIDALFIFVWILATISYISIAIYFCIYIFKKLTKISDVTSINYTFHLFILSLSLIPINYATFTDTIIQISKVGSLSIIHVASIIILILANLKLRHKKMHTIT